MRFLLAFAALAFAACSNAAGGEAGPSSVPTTASIGPVFTSGWDASGNPLPANNVTFVVNGAATFTVDANGQLPAQAAIQLGDELRVVSNHYDQVPTMLRYNGEASIALWPMTGMYDAQEVAEFASGIFFNNDLNGRLEKLPNGVPVSLQIGDDLLRDPLVQQNVEEACGKFSVHGHSCTVNGPGVPLRVTVNGNDPLFAQNPSWFEYSQRNHDDASSPWTITAGQMVFKTFEHLTSQDGLDTLLHALGHLSGLRHSPFPGDVMYASYYGRHMGDYSVRDIIAFRMQSALSAGVKPVDDRRPDSLGSMFAATARHPRGWVSVPEP